MLLIQFVTEKNVTDTDVTDTVTKTFIFILFEIYTGVLQSMQIFWYIIGQKFPWLNVQYSSGISGMYFSRGLHHHHFGLSG